MTDALTLLRQDTIDKKAYSEEDDRLVTYSNALHSIVRHAHNC
jgi:hypothetical protein